MTYQEWYSLMIAEGWEQIYRHGWRHKTAGTKSKGLFVCEPADSLAYWRAGMTPPPF